VPPMACAPHRRVASWGELTLVLSAVPRARSNRVSGLAYPCSAAVDQGMDGAGYEHFPTGLQALLRRRSRTRRTFVLPELLGSTTSIRRHPPRRFYAAASGYPLSHACFAVAG